MRIMPCILEGSQIKINHDFYFSKVFKETILWIDSWGK